MSDTPYDQHFVTWFREVTPYINAFRGKTFVLAFGGTPQPWLQIPPWNNFFLIIIMVWPDIALWLPRVMGY